jgi:beta-glucanase (GH16 family)
MISDSLNHWHTFACEWLPEHVIWYCDGQVINEFHDATHIPHHALVLKANYSIDDYALLNYTRGNPPEWEGTDAMIIDYVKVFQLQWDCDQDEIITSQMALASFNYGVKKSISITPDGELVKVNGTDKVTFRVTNSFDVTGPFQVDSGGEMTVIVQSCPAFEQ